MGRDRSHHPWGIQDWGNRKDAGENPAALTDFVLDIGVVGETLPVVELVRSAGERCATGLVEGREIAAALELELV